MKKLLTIALMLFAFAVSNAQNCNWNQMTQMGEVCAEDCGNGFCLGIRDTAVYRYEWGPSANGPFAVKYGIPAMISSNQYKCQGTGQYGQSGNPIVVCTHVIKIRANNWGQYAVWGGIQDGWTIRVSRKESDGTFSAPQSFTVNF